jgi:hypothetical protein
MWVPRERDWKKERGSKRKSEETRENQDHSERSSENNRKHIGARRKDQERLSRELKDVV